MERVDPLFLAFQSAVAGRYSLERELGRGGMGVVYLAREVRLDRLVAIKVLPPTFVEQPARARFLAEARIAARLSHPNIVPIFAVDEAAEFVYYTMAYVEGQTLAQRIVSHGPLSSPEATRILREVAWALGHAHAQHILHRDVKPANILLERESGRAMVADFGIAKLLVGTGVAPEAERVGTPEYMSPEQSAGDVLDGRSDIYSLGVVGFLALTGRLPFTGDTPQSLMVQHVGKPAPPVASVATGVRRALADAVDRCLQKAPAERFESASALADTLGEATAARAEVPVAVRLFLDKRRSIAPIALSAVILSWPVAMLLPIWRAGRPLTGPTDPIVIGIAASSLVLSTIWYLGRLRRLRAAGFGPDDIVRALRDDFRRRKEEFEFEYGAKPGKLERALRWLTLSGSVLVGFALMHGFASQLPARLFIPEVLVTLSPTLACGAGALMLAGARAARDSFWARVWDSKPGRWLARVVATGVRVREIPADRPTEVAIAMSAEALFAQLPRESRRALAEFPALIARLQARAQLMRARLTAIDAAGAGGDPQRFREMRAGAEKNLGEMVTALETLRLDLLRHSVGAMTLEGVTRDMSLVRELGAEAGRLLEAKREVERAVGPISPRPA